MAIARKQCRLSKHKTGLSKHKTAFIPAVMLTVMFLLFASPFSSYGMASKPKITSTKPRKPSATIAPILTAAPPQYCPAIKELTKDPITLRWMVGNKWNSYSESFVKEIGTFVGAQWVGIGVGKIICLYRGKDSFDFPIALEQVKSQIIFEPFGQHWSALVNNRKFCKSENIFDCPFSTKPEEKIQDIYEAIKYKEQDQATSRANDVPF